MPVDLNEAALGLFRVAVDNWRMELVRADGAVLATEPAVWTDDGALRSDFGPFPRAIRFESVVLRGDAPGVGEVEDPEHAETTLPAGRTYRHEVAIFSAAP